MRNIIIRVRLTEQERAETKAEAAKRGLTMSAYIRMIVKNANKN